MARIRTVKPEFFRHEKLFEVERATGLPIRIAFAGLWTAADREGRFRWQPNVLKLDCLPFDEVDFSLVLAALHENGLIGKYQTADGVFGFIPSWHKHQHVNVREAQSSLPEPSDESICEAGARTCTHVTARGEGKGKEQEGKGKEHMGGAVAPATNIIPIDDGYAFRGTVIRVKQDQLDKWRRAYPHVPDLMATLETVDAYYTETPPKDGKWFFAASNWLNKENAKFKETNKKAGYGVDWW